MRNYKIMRRVQLFWCLFIGLGAVGGSVGMLVATDGSAMGMQELLPYFQVLPFAEVLYQNFLFPGIALFLVNGLPNLISAALLIKKSPKGAYLSAGCGLILMLWITIQFVIFPANFMSTAYFIFGVLQLLCGVLCVIFMKQSLFAFDPAQYKNIGSAPDALVVYFSRRGYAKKLAYQVADSIGADLFEVTTPERTGGFLGFMWCGRFSMHNWPMEIDPVTVDPSKYSRVIIVTPVWVFTACAPILGFCKACKGRIARAEYISVHYRKSSFKGAFKAMDQYLGIHGEPVSELVCRYGEVKPMGSRGIISGITA